MKPKKSKLTARQPARRPKASLQKIRSLKIFMNRSPNGPMGSTNGESAKKRWMDWLQAERDILRDRDMGNSDT